MCMRLMATDKSGRNFRLTHIVHPRTEVHHVMSLLSVPVLQGSLVSTALANTATTHSFPLEKVPRFHPKVPRLLSDIR